MIVIEDLKDMPVIKPPISFAIGTFDGVHIGHQHLLQQMRLFGKPVVFTFTNIPAEVLRGSRIRSICSVSEKLHRLEKSMVEYCMVKTFDLDFANIDYQHFLEDIRQHIPFDHIFFAEGYSFGKDRLGNQENINFLGKKLNFQTHCIQKTHVDNNIVSSTLIRKLIEQNDTEMSNRLLTLG